MGPFDSARDRLRGLALLFLLVGVGCATLHPSDTSRRDVVLKRYFTQKAAAVLRGVPLRYGNVQGFCGIAIGDDVGSRVAGTVLGFGNQRQVVVGMDCDNSVVFHEYIHQAQYSGLIDTALFLERYAVLRDDPRYRHVADRWEIYVRRQYGTSTALAALLYGRGLTRELIAYTVQGYMQGWYELPEYFLDVYRDAVNLEARRKRWERW